MASAWELVGRYNQAPKLGEPWGMIAFPPSSDLRLRMRLSMTKLHEVAQKPAGNDRRFITRMTLKVWALYGVPASRHGLDLPTGHWHCPLEVPDGPRDHRGPAHSAPAARERCLITVAHRSRQCFSAYRGTQSRIAVDIHCPRSTLPSESPRGTVPRQADLGSCPCRGFGICYTPISPHS